MDLTDVSAARIVALGLTRSDRTPTEVVRRLACVQAQALGGALVSVALRSTDLVEVRAAVDRAEIVRTWTQRGTIHLAPAEDLGWILGLTAERVIRSTATRMAYYEVDEPMLEKALAIAHAEIGARGPLSRDELVDAFAPLMDGARAGEEYGRSRYLITTLAMRGHLVQGPLVTGRDEQLFALTSEWIRAPRRLDPADALREWTLRYVTSHGPVTLDDASRWMGLPKTPIKLALRELTDAEEIATVTVDGTDLWCAPDLEDRLGEEKEAAYRLHLLPGFDELILGYRDRTATLAAEHERAVVPGGNGMFKNTVVDGARVRATWKRSPRKTGPRVAVSLLPGETVDADVVEGVAAHHPAFVRALR